MARASYVREKTVLTPAHDSGTPTDRRVKNVVMTGESQEKTRKSIIAISFLNSGI